MRCLRDCRDVVVGRTFAKAYGLAGIRAGAVIGHPETIAALRRMTPPVQPERVRRCGSARCVRDRAYYDWYVDQVAQSRALLYQGFDRLGVRYWKSDANFVLARFDKRGPQSLRRSPRAGFTSAIVRTTKAAPTACA